MTETPQSFLVLDIETILDPELPLGLLSETQSLPPPPYHQIVVIGVLWIDRDYQVQRLGVIGDGKSEEGILGDFSRFLEERRPDLVTWNGRGFDLPVIAARCLRHGISFRHYYADRDMRYRFSPEGHFDLMDYLSDFGASRSAKLDVAAKLIGMPGKIGVDGKDIGPMVHAGKLAEVQAYCLSDVVQTAAIFFRLELVRGKLDREQYRTAVRALLAMADADPRVAPLGAAIQRTRLLLEG
jgi:predicted PolB exonuclease-like 3'-5' exonuclease